MSRKPSPCSSVNPRAAAPPAPSLASRLVPTRPTRTLRRSKRRLSRASASAISKESLELQQADIHSLIERKESVVDGLGLTGRSPSSRGPTTETSFVVYAIYPHSGVPQGVQGRRVVITGVGVVAPCGIGRDAFWAGLLGPSPSGLRRVSGLDASHLFGPKELRR